MFAQLIFYFPVIHNSLNHFLGWFFNHFTASPILEGDIIRLSKYIFKNPFFVEAWRKNVGAASFKAK